jgi:hypothetical protein
MAVSPEHTKILGILEKYPETQDMLGVAHELIENFETLTYQDHSVPIEATSSSMGSHTYYRWHRNIYPPLTGVDMADAEAFTRLHIQQDPLMGMNLTKGTLAISLATRHLTEVDNPLAQHSIVSIQLSRDYPRVFAFDSFHRSVLSGEWDREEEFSDLFLRSVAQFGLYQRASDLRELQLAS